MSRTRSRSRVVRRYAGPLAILSLCTLGAAGTWLRPAQAQTSSAFVPTFSSNVRLKKDLERLTNLAGQKKWDEWLAAYQQTVDDPRDLVMQQDEEFHVGVRHHLHQLLAAQPAGVRQRYRALYDNEARRQYDQAAKSNDGEAMREVYSRYRFSSIAPRALLWIGNRALDHGHSELACAAYGQLAKDPGVTVNTLLRYALAAQSAGRMSEAKAILERIRKDLAEQPAQVAGQKLNAAAAADLLAKELKAETAATGPDWGSFAGDGRRRMATSVSGGLKKMWEFAQPTTTGSSPQSYSGGFPQFSGYYGGVRGRFSYLTFPVARDGKLWVQGPRNLTALDLASGEPVWDRQDFLTSRDEVGEENTNPRTGGLYLRSGRPVQAAPSLDGHLLATRMPLSLSEREGGRWPVTFALTVCDARSGSQLWRRLAGGDPPGLYFNIPTLRGNVVYSGYATNKGGITEFTAVALDAGTGETLWSTYLGGGSDPVSSVCGSPPAIRDGLVWIETTLYTLSALDLVTGDVRLVYRYNPIRRHGSSQRGFDTSPAIPNEPASLIASGAGPVVFAPRWGTDVVGIDGSTGKLLWSAPKAPQQGSIGTLFAVDDKHAYICGDHVQAINLADGSRDWTWEPEQVSSNSVGVAALAGDRIYVMADNAIYVRAAKDGKEVEKLDLKELFPDSPGLTSLLALDRMLILCTKDKVLALGPK